MAILSETELKHLKVERIIFHLVGPDPSKHFRLLEEVRLSKHADFITARIQSSANGNLYQFTDDSATLALLRDMAKGRSFIKHSQTLANQFQNTHPKNALPGVFIVAQLRVQAGSAVFALMKMDHKDALSYEVKDVDGAATAVIERIANALTDDKNAVQKLAIVRMDEDDATLHVRDRSENGVAPRYFEEFLGANPVHENRWLTEKLLQIVGDAIANNRDELPVAVRLDAYDKLQRSLNSGDIFVAEQPELMLSQHLGIADPDSPIITEVKSKLRELHLESSVFEVSVEPDRVSNRREIVTEEGVVIHYNKDDNEVYVKRGKDKKGRPMITITSTSARLAIDDAIPQGRKRKY